MTTYDILKHAIINRQQVICDYDGYRREICPHVIGTKHGREQVLSFQFGGSSSSGLPPEGQWRCMVVERIIDARAQGGAWHTGDNHSRPQTCVDDIDAEVNY